MNLSVHMREVLEACLGPTKLQDGQCFQHSARAISSTVNALERRGLITVHAYGACRLLWITDSGRKADEKVQRVRRIVGYLAPTNRWNAGKLAELKDRKLHCPRQASQEKKYRSRVDNLKAVC